MDDWEKAKRFRAMAKHLAKLIHHTANHNFHRAGGDVECEYCGLKYYDHPVSNTEGLVIICDGRLVKL